MFVKSAYFQAKKKQKTKKKQKKGSQTAYVLTLHSTPPCCTHLYAFELISLHPPPNPPPPPPKQENYLLDVLGYVVTKNHCLAKLISDHSSEGTVTIFNLFTAAG